MNSKKKVIIAALLFIFLGLTVFTFANPDDEENILNAGSKNEVTNNNQVTDIFGNEDNNNVETNQDETNTQENVATNTNNNNTTKEDNSYQNALEALTNAEEKMDEESYQEALELVELVTREKEELTNRLEELRNNIDVKVLVETLEEMTNEATSKDDMDDARTYRVEKNVITLVDELTNVTLKEELTTRLSVVAKLLDDEVLELNIADEAVFKENTKIEIEDDNELAITLTVKEETRVIENGEELTDGVYTLKVVDRAFNEKTITFTIDTKAPVLTIVSPEIYQLEAGAEYVEKGYSAYDEIDEDVTSLIVKKYEFKENGTDEFVLVEGIDNSKAGIYKITYTAYDKAENNVAGTREVEYVDTVAPIINLPGTAGLNKNELIVESGTKVTYEDLLAMIDDVTTDSKLAPHNANLLISNDPNENTYNIKDFTNGLDTNYVGRYNIEYKVTDKGGNTTTATMLLVMKDTIAPVINLPGTAGLNKNELIVESGTKITYEDLLAMVDDATAIKEIAPYKAHLLISNVAAENKYNITDFTNGLDTNYVGRYNIEYKVTDKGGNTTFATMLLVMKDTTAPVINLPGTAGLNKNELIVESGTKITYEDLIAMVDDATTDNKLAPYNASLLISDIPEENTYNIKDFTNGLSTNYVGRYNVEYKVTDNAGNTTYATMLLVMKDTKKPIVFGINKDRIYAKVNVTVTDATKVTATINGLIYELGTDYAVAGSHMLVVTDAAGNYTRVPFIIDSTPVNLDENGYAKLDKDITIVDQPFYNVVDSTSKVTIDGNNKTVTQHVTKEEMFNWTMGGTRPNVGNMFASSNGHEITIKNLTFKGTTQSIALGKYVDTYSNNYNTTLDNVTIKGLNVVSYGKDSHRKFVLAPALVVYGNATIKNTTITGTKLSSFDNENLYKEGYTDSNGWKYRLYDLAAVNYSVTTIENSTVGNIYLWAKAKMTIKNSVIDEIPFTPNTAGGLVIEESQVNKIAVTNSVSTPSLTITNSTINVLDVTTAKKHTNIIITNSTISKVLTSEGEMTLEEYQAWK